MGVFRTGPSAALLLLAGVGAAGADGKRTLTLWMEADRGVDEVRAITERFATENGIAVVIETSDSSEDAFEVVAQSGGEPDIVLAGHDRLGGWAEAGLITPLGLLQAPEEGVLDVAEAAVRFDGEVWGYPVAVAAIGLIYNADMIDEAPETLEEIAMLPTPVGVRPILWDYSDARFSFPLMAAGGGDAVAEDEVPGAAVNGSAAQVGAEAISELIRVGAMPEGVDHAAASAAMKAGEALMVIDGPEVWAGLDASGINYAVAPLPSVDGNPAVPFVEVYAAAISAASPEHDLAVALLEEALLSPEGLAEWNAEGALVAPARPVADAGQAADERIVATLESAAAGVPAPPEPAMDRLRAALAPALVEITAGNVPVVVALDAAAERLEAE